METGHMTAAVDLMLDIISKYREKNRGMWDGARLEGFRRLHNTARGEIGEQFVRQYLERSGINARRIGSRADLYDIEVRGKKFEVKTASEGLANSFQFDHVRLDVNYDYLLALAVSPESLRFGAWSRQDVKSGAAGKLVRMAKGQDVTYKITRRADELSGIEKLPGWINARVPK